MIINFIIVCRTGLSHFHSLAERVRIILPGFFLLWCSCAHEPGRQDPSAENESGSPAPDSFTSARAEVPAGELAWRLQQGQQGSPVQIVSCTVNKKQELELRYRNNSAEPVDGVRIILFGYNAGEESLDLVPGTSYQYITDQQLVAPGSSGKMVYSLQNKQVSSVTAYVIKVHYTSGGSWENH